jgi:uncharacterized protein YegP (UPF0339 family)
MTTSAATVRIKGIRTTDDELVVAFADGRTLSVPLVWYPRLLGASPEQRSDWRLIGDGYGVHWPQIDEDLSAAGLLRGVHAPTVHPESSRLEQNAPKVSEHFVGAKFEIYRDADDEYRWRFRADNNEVVASGEGYLSRDDCEHAVQMIKEQAPQAEVDDAT